jgi:DNA-binding transcriptional LysR family regulator
MSDIGETVFLPTLMRVLAREAPQVRIETHQVDEREIPVALESGRLDLAIGSLPLIEGLRSQRLLHERYVVVLRRRHPLARLRPGRAALGRLDYVLVRAHSATLRALRELGLAERIRLSIPHFLVLPRILAETDLAAVMPERLSAEFARMGDYVVWRPRVGLPTFDVGVHWYWRFEGEPGNRWLRDRIVRLFGE